MHKIHGRTISDATVQLDDGDWQNCTFVRCRLVYAGGKISWGQNSFEGSDLVLVGAPSIGHMLAQQLPVANTDQFAPMRLASEFEDN